jgi:hypothetical protein
MTRDEVTKLASMAGFETRRGMVWVDQWMVSRTMERFAAFVAAAEREACAKVAESGNFLHDDSPAARFGKECAAAIRRRREK